MKIKALFQLLLDASFIPKSKTCLIGFLILGFILSMPLNSLTAQGIITLEPNNINPNSPSSYIIGIQRNHIFAQVKEPTDLGNTTYSKWFSEMLNRYGRIQPNFGNQKKLYRLGGNQIDGMISTLQEKEFNNPTRRNFKEVVNTCKNEILAISKTSDVFGNGQIYRVYKNSADASGPNDRFIYFEDADYKGLHWEENLGLISNKTGGSQNYGQYDDLTYYVTEAKTMDADLTVTVNFSSGTPAEAIGMIGEIKRLYDGTLERLQFIELGNEVSEPYIKGNRNYFAVDKFGNCVEHKSKSKNRKEYAHHAMDFAYQLRKWLDSNGGKHVKIGVVGTTNSFWAWNDPDPKNGSENLATLLKGSNPSYPGKKLLDYIDFVIYHSYPSYPIIHPGGEYGTKLNNPNTGAPYSDEEMAKLFLAQTQWNLDKRLEDQKKIIKRLTSKDIKLANSEYYSHINQVTRNKLTHSITEGIYTADNMIAALKHDMNMAVNFAFYHFQDNQNEISDNLLFDINKDGKVVGEKTVFAVHKLVAEELGNQIIGASDDFAKSKNFDIDISNLTFWKTGETNFKYKPLNYIVTKKSNGDIVMLVVNRGDQDVPLSIANSGFNSPFAYINSIKGSAYTDQSHLKPTGFKPMSSLNNFTIPKLSINMIKISKTQMALKQEALIIDLDLDGVGGYEDCDDNNPLVPTKPGTACDDGNYQTSNDVIQSDGCTCRGKMTKKKAKQRKSNCVVGFNKFDVETDATDPNCRNYILEIQPKQSMRNVKIDLTNFPTNGAAGFTVAPFNSSSLNWKSPTSYEWALPNVVTGQTYEVTVKYCWMNKVTYPVANFDGCANYPCN